MAKYLILLFSLFTSIAHATITPVAGSSVQLGLGTANSGSPAIVSPIASASALKTLAAGHGSMTQNHFYSFVNMGQPGAQTQYKVTTGKVLYCFNIRGTFSSAQKITIGYGTAALAANDTATPPTGVIYYGASSTVTESSISFPTDGGTSTWSSFPQMISFPALSFPFFIANATGTSAVQLDCLEQ